MIPSLLANEIRSSIADYLRTEFSPTTPSFTNLIENFLQEEDSIFKGCYLSIGFPFRQGNIGKDFFPSVPMKFTPHRHQELAFNRLKSPHYQSTLVATGTGSGKTECYMIPILAHCADTFRERGIKAILIYPMNALATDQAKRLASLIWHNPNLKGKVTAGLYVGDTEREPKRIMGEDNVITDKNLLRKYPPDILLTNYKMLDYLLIRPSNQTIWGENTPETLRYLVVDEIHTFDGAQGTDLACLIRRLKARLKTPYQHLACVGTSATLGGQNSKQEMLHYAQTIFNESFNESAIIEEDRLSSAEFLANALIDYPLLPTREDLLRLHTADYPSLADYIRSHFQLWFQEELKDDIDDLSWRVKLGDRLKSLFIMQNLLKILDNHRVISLRVLWQELSENNSLGQRYNDEEGEIILNSLLTLGAIARNDNGRAWVNIRLQFWLRELRRMVATVSKKPKLVHYDDLSREIQRKTLPVIHCRHCGSTGWGGLRRQTGDNKISCDVKDFYVGYFSQNPLITFVFPDDASLIRGENKENTGGLRGDSVLHHQLCSQCLTLNRKDATFCNRCGSEELISVIEPNNLIQSTTKNNETLRKINHDCPLCGSKDGLIIIGSRAASLASAGIGTFYSSSYNDDPKLICFSDSVQDAAHRAGFFEARTYRMTLRSAICQYLEQMSLRGMGKESQNLEQIRQEFANKMRSHFNNDGDYVATFMPSDLEWLKEWESLQNGGKLDPYLTNFINQRLDWEIIAELGLYSKKGGSLEKSYSCSIGLNQSLLTKSLIPLQETLVNEIGGLEKLSLERLKQLIIGMVYHLRQQGGILHSTMKSYIESGGNTFVVNKENLFMPRFGSASLKPTYLSQKNLTFFETLLKSSGNPTWYETWAYKLLGNYSPLIISQLESIYGIILSHLVEKGIFGLSLAKNNIKVWGIEQKALQVDTNSHQFRCNHCSHEVLSTPDNVQLWENMPCLRPQCHGFYQENITLTSNFYRNLYRNGNLRRIFAREHTGLLSREVREELENRFIQGDRKTDPNLLSATSTLEMGIDIGDLSSVLLCSIPPNQANYQQRVGRAGRRDGNALITAIANGKPHDLYFWANPLKMLDGGVMPPGSYLDASAILQRQLTAYCLDRWVVFDKKSIQILEELGKVLGAIESKNLSRFPYPWLDYIDQHQQELLQDFIDLFNHSISVSPLNPPLLKGESHKQEIISDLTIEQLRLFIEKGQNNEGGLTWQILNRLQEVIEERKRLKNQIESLKRRLTRKEKEAKSQHYEEEIAELKRERDGLLELVKQINSKNILNFLTDEGLLPNYAFPEPGVTLKSVIWRKNNSQNSKYDTKPFEYERPSAIAIRELVPSGVFYAEGKQVKIDQIDLSLSKIQEWRLCRNCSFATEAIRDIAHQATCPRCGDIMWSDEGRKRKLLRLRQVMATSSAKDSGIGDDRDERNTAFFTRQMLVDFEPNYCENSYLIDDETFPFGFEFVSKVTFREINFGEPSHLADNFEVAGESFPRAGFKICRHCGKVQNSNNEKNNHTFACRIRNNNEREEDFVDVVYLFREFSSEAIRFLMPVDTLNSDQQLHSFIAALQLGLKLYFKGNVDHLKTLINQEPSFNSPRLLRKPFLFLYDTIPGGSGYLRQLLRNPDNFFQLFQQALMVLKTCECEDGCYNCLYGYRNSFDRDYTSRTVARNLLNSILSRQCHLKPHKSNLSQVPLNALFDSVLEQRFIEALRHYRHNDQPTIVRKEIINGKAGYFLQMGGKSWNIEPQVELSTNQGVNIPSRADFVFYPTKKEQSKPIAIFTDGWQYHCDRTSADFNQRMAINKTGEYYIWSLTWQDVESEFNSNKNQDYYYNFLENQSNKTFTDNKNRLYQQYQCTEALELINKNSFLWLMNWLVNPDEQLWTKFALINTLAYLNPLIAKDEQKKAQWYQDLARYISPHLFLELEKQIKTSIYGDFCYYSSDNVLLVDIKSAIAPKLHQEGNPQSVFSLIILNLNEEETEEEKQKLWNGILRLFNLYQFLPYNYLITPDNQLDAIVEWDIQKHSPQVTVTTSKQWLAIEEFALEEVYPLIAHMKENNWQLPETGYELTNDIGTVIAEAELAWSDYQFAIVIDESEKQPFSQYNWVAVTLEEILTNPQSYYEQFLCKK